MPDRMRTKNTRRPLPGLKEQRSLSALVVLLALAVLANRASSAGVAKDMRTQDKEALAARIIAAWTERQNAIRNVRAKLAVDCTIGAGFSVDHPTTAGRQQPPDRNQEYSRVITVLLDFENQRQRVDEEGGIYALHLGRVVQERRMSSLVNGKGKTYEYRDWPEAPLVHHGKIGGERAFTDETSGSASPYMLPFLWYIRPLEPFGRSWAPRSLRVIGTERSGSLELVECELVPGLRAWLDANRDYVFIRCEGGRRCISVDYELDDRYGPVPKQWMSVETEKDGGLREVNTARFLEREINGALDESMFEFEFPEGTTVDEMGGANRTLIVMQDKQLVPPSRIEESAGRSGWIRVWLIAANALIVVLVSAYLLRRRLQRA